MSSILLLFGCCQLVHLTKLNSLSSLIFSSEPILSDYASTFLLSYNWVPVSNYNKMLIWLLWFLLHLSHDIGNFLFFNFFIRPHRSDVSCSYLFLVFVQRILRDDEPESRMTSERDINNLLLISFTLLMLILFCFIFIVQRSIPFCFLERLIVFKTFELKVWLSSSSSTNIL